MKKKLIVMLVCALLAVCVFGVSAYADDSDFKIEDGVLVKYTGEDMIVTIPDGVTAIGDEAFRYCHYLTEISIPDSVTSIGANPFIGEQYLYKITISPDHPVFAVVDNVLFNKVDKQLIYYPKTLTASSYTIPEGILCIGDFSFFNQYALTEISIPDSVTSIGTNPFLGCYRLQKISISPNHSSFSLIDGALFSNDDNRLIYYPCSSSAASSYSIPNGTLHIGNSAFYNCNISEIFIPDSVTFIDDSAFEGCSSLTEISIPDSVTFIGDSAFSDCYYLTHISLPDSITFIGNETFSDCHFHEFYIPTSVTIIGNSSFEHCDQLTEMSIPDSVTFIGNEAFSRCYSLTEIYIPDSVTFIGENAFEECPYLTITVERDSYAEQYCKDNGLNYNYPDSLDWLNS